MKWKVKKNARNQTTTAKIKSLEISLRPAANRIHARDQQEPIRNNSQNHITLQSTNTVSHHSSGHQ